MTVSTVAPGLTQGTWNIDPAHSEVTFVIRHLMSKVRGSFSDFSGQVVVGDDVATSTATAEIKVTSVETRNADRDAHLRSAEIFDAEKHPLMTFSTNGVRAEGGDYFVDGELEIRGVRRPVTLAVEFNGVGGDPYGGTRAGFSATTSINRKDFGLEFNVPLQGDKVLLGDKVEIQLEIQAVLAA
ncbi:YceI family protein [Actinomadura sp. HBU206391]|uniref:YceI family protein n=1 Tax=Actinomadura sp. HBU206391 TaxID=2731692 RepID=UPI0016500AA3|nr:YceI family protein [Actinomadura sp. HBU206391]MBC6460960.1 polyisoprenoid-binding protein [Actinomadura sp. HBU206391]